MISRDATLAFTQAALALASLPHHCAPYSEHAARVADDHVQGRIAVERLERVIELLRRGAAPDVTAVAKLIVELEATNMR